MRFRIYISFALFSAAFFALSRCAETKEPARAKFEITRVDVRNMIRPFSRPDELESRDRKVVLRVEQTIDSKKMIEHVVRLYDQTSGKPLGPQIQPDLMRPTALAIADDNKTIATGGTWMDGGGCAEVWDATTGKKIAEWSTGGVVSLRFSKDAKTVFVKCGRTPKS